LFDSTGEVRSDVVDAVVDAVGIGTTVFEAPLKEQQAWLIRRFGPDVNLANVAPSDALGLEALRLGLRADTFDTTTERMHAR
jgi:phosphosulfolactate synthase